jgi:peroxiredoxin
LSNAKPLFTSTPPAAPGLGRGERAFVGALLTAGLALGVWVAYRQWAPRETPAAEPNVADMARTYLRARKAAPLSEATGRLLADPASFLVRTQDHPLLGKPAPAFRLSDHEGRDHRLSEYVGKGPVVLVFYYGYHCDHCVSQLFDVNEDMGLFREVGAEVVAVSPDSPARTRDRFGKYGAFQFPVLADPGNRVAEQYGVFAPGTRERPENLLHGTFVIDREGVVRWAMTGDEPFTGNRTLLYELARLEGRLSSGK